ncbi:hypothetical protein CPB85DRAFT_1439995 [Mucidula mucida]|nr:hypothetical protein CPB85DRAFT_1439995 [Mucidula mucida]
MNATINHFLLSSHRVVTLMDDDQPKDNGDGGVLATSLSNTGVRKLSTAVPTRPAQSVLSTSASTMISNFSLTWFLAMLTAVFTHIFALAFNNSCNIPRAAETS